MVAGRPLVWSDFLILGKIVFSSLGIANTFPEIASKIEETR